MLSLILAVVVSASGDPYCQWFTEKTLLTTAQRTTFVNQVISRAPGLPALEFSRLECSRQNGSACCIPWTFDPQTGDAIRDLLIAGTTWSPGQEAGTQTKLWPTFCISGTALSQFVNYIGGITPDADGLPLLGAVFDRTPGTNNVYLTTEFKRPMSAVDCAAYSGRTLVPMGVVP
jgi:hypothetical protein